MKYIILLFTLLSFHLSSQAQTKKIEIKNDDSYLIFYVFEKNPQITYLEDKEYSWYLKDFGIRKTRGGAGGLLLSGEYTEYEKGYLKVKTNFRNGLKNGEEIYWNNQGEIKEKKIFKDGDYTYWRVNQEYDEKGNEYSVELIGNIYKVGSIKKIYVTPGGLVSESKLINDTSFIYLIKEYYPFDKKLKAQYHKIGLFAKYMYGPYVEYFENGKVKINGEFSKSDLGDFKVGKWIQYDENNNIIDSSTYKLSIRKHDNGNVFSINSLKFFPNDGWFNDGIMKRYTESGNLIDEREFDYGKLKRENEEDK